MMKTGTSLTLPQATLQRYFQISVSVMLLQATTQLQFQISANIMLLQVTYNCTFKLVQMSRCYRPHTTVLVS
jgi:hypothetical protein